MLKKKRLLFVTILFFFAPFFGKATEYTSTNFKIVDPVLVIMAGRSTSGSYALEQSVGQFATAISNSTTFGLRAGFLYFPAPSVAATTPTPSTVPVSTPGEGGIPGLAQPLLPFAKIPSIYLPPVQTSKTCSGGDLNCDLKVDLADFSIFLYLSAFSPEANPADLNKDGLVDLGDASVMFYKWSEKVPFALPKFAEFKPELSPRQRIGLVRQVAPRPISYRSIQKEVNLAQAQEAMPTGIFKRMFNSIKSITGKLVQIFGKMLK